MNKIANTIFSVLLLITVDDYAQQGTSNNKVTKPSAEVASIAKFVEFPMDISSGLPQIGIDIHTLSSGSIQLPISLGYNASGVKVEESASCVGLGWAISKGPFLARMVNGLPDESFNGYIFAAANRSAEYLDDFNNLPLNSSERFNIEVNEYSNNNFDTEADVFTFSVMGYSGSFSWDQTTSQFIVSPIQDIKIECSSLNTFGVFTFTMPDGVKVYFGDGLTENCYERMVDKIRTPWVNGNQLGEQYGLNNLPITSWQASKITDASGKEIVFTYQLVSAIEYAREAEILKLSSGSNPPQFSTGFSKNTYLRPVIKQIVSDNETVNFIYQLNNREDLADTTKALDSIIIKNINNEIVKKFGFVYEYSTSDDYMQNLPGIIGEANNISRKRLILKSVNKVSSLGVVQKNEFTYSSKKLPNRLSASQDYWGYYNGKNLTHHFTIPRVPNYLLQCCINGNMFSNNSLPIDYINPNAADRRIDTAYSYAGILTSMKLPTGGTVNYFYEPNEVSNTYWQSGVASLELPDMKDKSYVFSYPVPSNAPYPNYFVDTFFVSNPVTTVKIQPNLPPPCSEMASVSCKGIIRITSIDNNNTDIQINVTPVIYRVLPQGRYKIELNTTNEYYEAPPEIHPILTWGERRDSLNFYAGGLRIKKIVLQSNAGSTLTRSYRYKLDGTNISSGILMGCPSHLTITEKDPHASISNFPAQAFISSSSGSPLSNDGQIVRYNYVEEYMDTVGIEQKTAYHYLTDINTYSFNKTGLPVMQKPWMNNKLLQKNVFEKSGNNYNLVYNETNSYFVSDISTFRAGYRLSLDPQYGHCYYRSTERIYISSYSQTTKSGTLEANMHNSLYYNAKYQLQNTESINSKAALVQKKIWYPTDFDNISFGNINILKAKYIHSVPMREDFIEAGKLKSSFVYTYNSNGKVLKKYQYTGPVLPTPWAHNPAAIDLTNYTLEEEYNYDTNDNLVEIKSTSGITKSFIWGYQSTQPVAMAENAGVNEIAFENFEGATLNGSFTEVLAGNIINGCFSGNKQYSFANASLKKTGLVSGKTYVVEYWSTSGSLSVNGASGTFVKSKKGYNLYRHTLIPNGSNEIVIVGSTVTIDDLRFFPAQANMTSYSYRPLVGITAQTDPNNNNTFYSYDHFNRLTLINDEDNNIIKKICYNYAGQSVNCQ